MGRGASEGGVPVFQSTMYTAFIALILGVVCLIALLGLLRAGGDKQLNASMQQEADRAVVNALRNFSIRLDFSPGSAHHVESILSKYYGNPKLPGTANDMALQLGAYLGEVIRRQKGGKWRIPPGKDIMDVEIAWGERSVPPVQWCAKRILNGQSDNVWLKFQFITDQKAAATAAAAEAAAPPKAAAPPTLS